MNKIIIKVFWKLLARPKTKVSDNKFPTMEI